MPLKTMDASVSNFEQVFDEFRSEKQIKLLLFLADKDPATSRSWCPDCVRAEPVIYQKLEASAKDVVLLKAYVGDRPTWRNPSHPLRVDQRFKLTGVPTLIRWENDVTSSNFCVVPTLIWLLFECSIADCVRAEPVIYQKLEASAKDVVLLKAYVGDRPTWRNPSHPLRVDQRFKLTGVPTLIRWENDAIAGRLEDDEAHIANKIDALVNI